MWLTHKPGIKALTCKGNAFVYACDYHLHTNELPPKNKKISVQHFYNNWE